MAELNFVPLPEHDPARRKLMDHFLRLVADATKCGDRLRRFPGTMPMTLSRRHLDMVCGNDYVCLEKSDGTRYMLFAISTHVFFIDRRSKVYPVDPNPEILTQGFSGRQDNTILDGELTYNMITNQYEYLIYDAVAIDGDLSIASKGFRERMQAAETFVAAPRAWAPFYAGLLRLRIKDFHERNQIRNLFDRIRKDPSGNYIYVNNDRRDGPLCNLNDGAIFVPVKLPYHVKNSTTLLKWKPPHLNSVDFQMLLTPTTDSKRKEPSVRVTLAYKGDGQDMQHLREVHIPHKIRRHWAADLKKYHNTVAEFAYDRGAGEWRYIRQREDKEIPNFSNTIISTLETIAESVEREELVIMMEKTPSPPRDQQPFVDFASKNAAACTFRNDLFDDRNLDYLETTPISVTSPPNMVPPPNLENRRGRGSHGRRDSSRVANGEPGRRRDDSAPDSEQGRVPFVYADDV